MSSTPSVGTPTPVIPSVSFSVPPLSSLLPSSGANTISPRTSATTLPALSTSVLVTLALSEQSRQSSSVLQHTMTTAVVTVQSLASPSVPSLTIPITSARVSSMFSMMTVTSNNNDSSTTSTPEISVQPTTPTITTAPNTVQSSTLTSFPPATTVLNKITSTPTLATTSNAPFTSTSSPLSSNISSQGSSPGRTNLPLTTVLESTTIFVTSTNSQGQVVTSIPPVVTEVITTTGSGGIVTTVTQAIVNPTLAPNNSTSTNSSFFANTGAVVGVFVVVGLASASIMIWILFAIRHRQRMRRIEQDTAVEAAVAAAGLNRAPLDDDEDDSPVSPNNHHHFSSGTSQRSRLFDVGGSGSLPTSARLSEVLDDTIKDNANSHPEHPMEQRVNRYLEGYVPARTASPSPPAEGGTDDVASSRGRKSSYGHTPTYSAGSFEPLLANYVHNAPDQDTSYLATEPQRNRSSQHLNSGLVLNGYSSDGSPGNGSRTSSKRQNSSNGSVPQDEEDYTRYVLMVRNVPDDQSQRSL